MIRLFVRTPLSEGAACEATPDQARYLTSVMRLGVGDEVLLFNGGDGEWRAQIAAVTKRGCTLRALQQTRAQASVPDVELVMALVKRGPLELVVEKATELGARRIRLVTTRRTNADHTNVSRLEAIAIEAAEQCERLDTPPVDAPVKLSQLLADWPPDRRLLVCDEASARTCSSTESRLGGATSALDALRGSGPAGWSLLVGPEGGFDPEERAVILAHPAVTPVTLGPRILRAETAAIAVLTLWQAALGDWRRA